MTTKTALRQNRKPPKASPRRAKRAGPQPAVSRASDYDDEVTEDQLNRIKAAVKDDVESEELEVIDGPAW